VDIIDRLKALRGTAQDVGAVAIEEIERLRSRVKWFEEAGGVAMATRIYQRDSEIERLNTQVRELAMMVDGQVRTILRLQKEDSNDRP
jgi:thiamine biosynthesis lipoprotein ApbE